MLLIYPYFLDAWYEFVIVHCGVHRQIEGINFLMQCFPNPSFEADALLRWPWLWSCRSACCAVVRATSDCAASCSPVPEPDEFDGGQWRRRFAPQRCCSSWWEHWFPSSRQVGWRRSAHKGWIADWICDGQPAAVLELRRTKWTRSRVPVAVGPSELAASVKKLERDDRSDPGRREAWPRYRPRCGPCSSRCQDWCWCRPHRSATRC